jgi:hypothetical protein
MTRSTVSCFISELRLVTVSSADTAEVERPAFDWVFGDWSLGLGENALFKPNPARVTQSSDPATDLKKFRRPICAWHSLQK